MTNDIDAPQPQQTGRPRSVTGWLTRQLPYLVVLILAVLAHAVARAEPPPRTPPPADTRDQKVLRPGEVEIKDLQPLVDNALKS